MLTQIFKVIIFTSCVGSILAILLMIFKPVTKKYFSGNWNYYIWLVVLVAMMLPVKFGLPAKKSVQITSAAFTEPHTRAAPTNNLQAVTPLANITLDINNNFEMIKAVTVNQFDRIAYIWLVVAAFFLLTKMLAYMIFLRRIRKHSSVIDCLELSSFTSKRITVRKGDALSSPRMIGVLKPTLFLPNIEMTEEQLNNILCHEITHFKRHDIWYKWIAMLVKCAHWFNPVIYVVARQISTECEISCDLAVVSGMNKQEKMSYIDTILAILSGTKTKDIPLTTGMMSNKNQIKRRFMMIKNKTKVSKLTSVLSAFLAIVILFTTAFASGVLANETGIYDDNNIEVTKQDENIAFVNKPYIENNTLYLPLRETLSHFVDFSNGISEIVWDNNGEVVIRLFDEDSKRFQENGDIVYAYMYYYRIKIGTPAIYEVEKVACELNAPPVLKNNITFVPVEVLENIKTESGLLNGFNVSWYKNDEKIQMSSRKPLMTIDDVVALSEKAKTDGIILSDYDPFEANIDSSNDNTIFKRYYINEVYYLEISGDLSVANNLQSWLNNKERGDAINIESVYYLGEPWWGPKLLNNN